MRKLAIFWVLLLVLAALAIIAAPAASVALGGGTHIACGGQTSGCQ
jgi:hypothetical protein